MKNLAGNADCDEIILRELERARIPWIRREREGSEVPYSIRGILSGFTFRRAWRYWVVTGPLPLVIAERLYADPVGKTDIRVGGHCGCPGPREYGVEWFDSDGRRILPMQEQANCLSYAASESILKEIGQQILAESVFSDNPESIGGRGFVTLYHIDSEVGLRLFADTLRRHGLAPEVGTP